MIISYKYWTCHHKKPLNCHLVIQHSKSWDSKINMNSIWSFNIAVDISPINKGFNGKIMCKYGQSSMAMLNNPRVNDKFPAPFQVPILPWVGAGLNHLRFAGKHFTECITTSRFHSGGASLGYHLSYFLSFYHHLLYLYWPVIVVNKPTTFINQKNEKAILSDSWETQIVAPSGSPRINLNIPNAPSVAPSVHHWIASMKQFQSIFIWVN